MTGFELQTSGIGSNRCTNWATTTAVWIFVILKIKCFVCANLGSICSNLSPIPCEGTGIKVVVIARETQSSKYTDVSSLGKVFRLTQTYNLICVTFNPTEWVVIKLQHLNGWKFPMWLTLGTFPNPLVHPNQRKTPPKVFTENLWFSHFLNENVFFTIDTISNLVFWSRLVNKLKPWHYSTLTKQTYLNLIDRLHFPLLTVSIALLWTHLKAKKYKFIQMIYYSSSVTDFKNPGATVMKKFRES